MLRIKPTKQPDYTEVLLGLWYYGNSYCFINLIFKDNVYYCFVVYGLLIAYIVWILKLSPFFMLKTISTFKGWRMYRNTAINKINGPIEILKVESTKEDSYICSFKA